MRGNKLINLVITVIQKHTVPFNTYLVLLHLDVAVSPIGKYLDWFWCLVITKNASINNVIHLSEYICKDYPSRINSPNKNWWVKGTLSFSRLKSITNLCSKENLPIYILSQSTFTMPSLTLCNTQLFGICSLTGEKATAHCSNLPFSSYKWSWTLKRRAKVHVSVYIKQNYPLLFLNWVMDPFLIGF